MFLLLQKYVVENKTIFKQTDRLALSNIQAGVHHSVGAEGKGVYRKQDIYTNSFDKTHGSMLRSAGVKLQMNNARLL